MCVVSVCNRVTAPSNSVSCLGDRLCAVMAEALLAACLGFQSYQTQIPNSHLVKDCEGILWGGVGHARRAGGGPRNQFGLDFAAAGYTWTAALCNMDSDNDGITNGAELGDPSCTWVPGTNPQFDVGITHPGMDCGSLNCDGSANNSASAPSTPLGCAAYTASTTAVEDLTFSGHPVGSGTTYIKGAFTWSGPIAAVTRFEIINVNPLVVHHMILYKCPTDVSAQYGVPATGLTMGCSEVLMAWAVGGSDFCAPQGLAFQVTPSEPYFLLGE